MKDSTIKFGLIGFGAWGKCHADAIRKTDGAELVAICAKSKTSCAAACSSFPEAKVFSDFSELLKLDDIDAIDIALPSFLHHQVASAVLKSGRHLLLEKPMCLSVEHCDDLIKLASNNNRILAIGHELRLSSLWSKVKQLIDDGSVGDPQYVLVELSRKPYRLGADGWRYDIDRVGNWILEEPIHFFDLARWYLSSSGEPISVFASANSRQTAHPELQDNFSAILKFADGAHAVISQSLSMFEHHQTVKIAGTDGSIWASWGGAMDRTRHPTFFLKISGGDQVSEIKIDKITGEVFELEDQMSMMVRAIRNNETPIASGQDGKRSVAMCLAAQKSVETGAPVKMSEIL